MSLKERITLSLIPVFGVCALYGLAHLLGLPTGGFDRFELPMSVSILFSLYLFVFFSSVK